MGSILVDSFDKIVFPTNTNIEAVYANWIQFIAGSSATGLKGAVYLPLPQNISFGTTLQWNDISLGIIEGVVDEFSSNLNEAQKQDISSYDKVVDSANGVMKSLTDTVKNVGTNNIMLQTALVAEAYMQSGLRLPDSISNFEKPLDLIKNKVLRDNRVAINPNTELYFKGVGLRNFSFRFQLVPKSQADSKTIRNVIRFFERWSHPDFLKGGRYVFTYPEEFIITFISNGKPNDNFPSINRCVITNFTHTYMENSNALMQDNAPPSVSMSISFREVEVNTRDTINRPQSDYSRLQPYSLAEEKNPYASKIKTDAEVARNTLNQLKYGTFTSGYSNTPKVGTTQTYPQSHADPRLNKSTPVGDVLFNGSIPTLPQSTPT